MKEYKKRILVNGEGAIDFVPRKKDLTSEAWSDTILEDLKGGEVEACYELDETDIADIESGSFTILR